MNITSRYTAYIPYLVITLVFIISRLVYIQVVGIRFDASSLTYFWQYLDVELLKNDLWRSVWYLHQQPPLFSLFLGLVLQGFEPYHKLVYQAIYLIFGLALACTQYALMEALGIRRKIALTLTILTMISLGTIIYENWLFYEYPTKLLVCLSALVLCKLCQHPSYRNLSLFMLCVTLLFLLRNIFHPIWICLWCGVIYWRLPHHRKKFLQAALPYIVFISLVLFKNYVYFGHLTPSSIYTTTNLGTRIYKDIPKPILRQLMEEDKIPLFSRNNPMVLIGESNKHLPAPAPTGMPVLDNAKKSNGQRNMNYMGTLAMSAEFERFFFNTFAVYPHAYFRSFKPTIQYFHTALHDDFALGYNRTQTKTLLPTYLLLCCGQTELKKTGWTLIILFPVLLAFAALYTWQQYRHHPSLPCAYIPTAFMLITILYVGILTTGISVGDFSRYRVCTDGLYTALFGLMLNSLWNWYSRHRQTDNKTRT